MKSLIALIRQRRAQAALARDRKRRLQSFEIQSFAKHREASRLGWKRRKAAME